MIENWKPVKGYEELYQISSLGRVKSLPRLRKHSVNHRVMFHTKERIMKTQINRDGYRMVCLSKNTIKTKKYVHRLIAESFIENPEGKEQVNHIDGNKQNNKLENLEWNTREENMQHAHDNGLMNMKKGEDIHTSKLTTEQVKEIRKMYKETKLHLGEIAEVFGVSVSNVYHIVKNKTWKEVQ